MPAVSLRIVIMMNRARRACVIIVGSLAHQEATGATMNPTIILVGRMRAVGWVGCGSSVSPFVVSEDAGLGFA